ncbi:MAG: hypothetical protein JWM35_2646 [Verrucomicrobia bacterium]|nr:hypothetical protein [Verrucomicrobiota bacterium]
MSRLRLPVLLLILGAAALTVAAGLMSFSTFMLYDDEGYVLFSLRNFVEHGGLYRDVYTQYGPFSYVVYFFLHVLGMPLTHMAGRLLTLFSWSAAASLSGWAVWRVTRHSACALVTLSAVFVYLWVMISEPNHPGGLIALLTSVIGLVGYLALASERWKTWAVLVGAGSAALVLTKINIGAFATLAAMSVILLHSRHDGVRKFFPWLLAAGLVLLPVALMRPLLGTPWIQTYAMLFAFAAVPVAGSLALAAAPRTGIPEWRNALLAGLAVVVVVLGVVFARGTTPSELVEGVVLGPLHHPGHFSLVFPWPAGAMAVASLSLALFALAFAALQTGRVDRVTLDSAIAALRLVAVLALALALWQFPNVSPDNLVFAFGLSALWVFLWPLTGEANNSVIARGWLGLLVLGQWLHAFPVPGSQIAWGTFLVIPLAAIGAWQAAAWIVERHSRIFTVARAQLLDLFLTVMLVMVAVVSGNRLGQIGARYLDSRSLELPGAEALRLPDSTTALYRLLVFNANAHGDMLFSLPGMFSFNLWTDLPAPTLANVTHWFSLLDDAQQNAIISSLAKHPRAVVIVQQDHIDFLRQRNLMPSGLLYDYIQAEFETAFMIDGFQFRVRRGRKIAPLQTAEVFQSKPAGKTAAASPDTLIKLQLLLPSDQSVASIEVARMDDHRTPPLVLNATNARIEVTSIDLAGAAHGQPEARTFPFTLRGPAEVAVYFDRGGRGISAIQSFFVVRNAAGAELALVRIRR